MAHYTVTRPSSPLADTVKLGASNLGYFPSFVDMRNNGDWPFDWAIYHSTDHDAGGGGIYLLVGNGDPSSPTSVKTYTEALGDGDFDDYVTKPGSEPIYADSTEGTQTETPCVRLIDSTYYMTYHNSGAGNTQSTLMATSGDGLNFTRRVVGGTAVILDYEDSEHPGDGHTGYFHWGVNDFADLPYGYIGWGLAGSSAGNTNWATYGATDPAGPWRLVQMLPRYGGVPTGGVAGRSGFLMGRPPIHQNSGGEWVRVVQGGESGSGGIGTPEREMYEVVLDEMGNVKREPQKILENGETFDGREIQHPHVFEWDGGPRVLYTAVDTSGNNELAVATATFNASASLPPLLAKPRRHVINIDLRDKASEPASIDVETFGSPSISYTKDGLEISDPGGTNVTMIRSADTFTPDDYDVVDIIIEQMTTPRTGYLTFGVTATETGSVNPAESIQLRNYEAINNLLRYESVNSSGTVVDSQNLSSDGSNYFATGIDAAPNTFGLRWWPAENTVEFVQHELSAGLRRLTLTGDTVDTSKAFYVFCRIQNQDAVIPRFIVQTKGSIQ